MADETDKKEQALEASSESVGTKVLEQESLEERIIQPVVEHIDMQMKAFQEKALVQILERVDQRVDELKVPQDDPDQLFGGAPAIRQGESPLTSRRYSYFRAMRALLYPDRYMQEAKVELSISRQLEEYYVTRNFKMASMGRSFLVPFGSGMLPDDIGGDSPKGNDAVPLDQMRQLLADPESLRGLARKQSLLAASDSKVGNYATQALSMFDDTALGIMVDSQITSEIIELVRAIEVFPRIGAREVTLPPNGHLPMGRQGGAATGNWIGETTTITTSEPTTGTVELRAKKAAALVVVPNELFRFATRDTEGFIRADLARVLALLVDLAGLEGVGGTNEPLGIIKHAGIITKVAGTTSANGDTLEPNDLSGLMAEIEEKDHDVDSRGFAWILRGKMWQNILNRRAAVLAAGDQEGGYLFAVNREAINNGIPSQLLGWPVVRSGQISNTRTKGSGTNLTYILGGIPDDVIIGRIGVLEFTLGMEGTVNSINLFETDQSAIRAIEHADFAMRHESSWGFVDSLDQDLPSGAI